MQLGTAEIDSQDPLVAGSYQTVHWTYTAGHPIDDMGHIMIAFRHCGDFGAPQFHAPAEVNYCTVRTSGNCVIEPRWDPKGHVRPWTQCLLLTIYQGFLASGDKVHVVFGDTSRGSPGWRTQTFPERAFEFKTLVDPVGTQLYKELQTSPTVKISPGPPVRGRCIAPSSVAVGHTFSYDIRWEDRWGNPSSRPVRFQHPGFHKAGVQTVLHEDRASQTTFKSNPIEIIGEETTQRRFWADFHGQSEETVGTNSIDDYFVAARDYALLDIASHQGNDFQITDSFWEQINRTTELFHSPGRFVTFPGYEWSGNTPLGGDRNVLFAQQGGGIYRSSLELIPGNASKYPICLTAVDLFERLARDRDDPGVRPFVFAHVGGRYADLSMHDAELEWAVEIHSAWGTFEWLLDDALKRGYRVGVVANSDDHRGSPGASYPGAKDFGSLGGLTCVLAKTLSRTEIVKALQRRHTYATTGHRCLLHVELDAGEGHPVIMGDTLITGHPSAVVRVHAVGTAPIESLDIRNGSTLLHQILPGEHSDDTPRVKIAWWGAERAGRARAAHWDGSLHIEGNAIRSFEMVNFWNPDSPVRNKDERTLVWESSTTGGVAGVVVDLADPRQGTLVINTPQGRVECDLAQISATPLEWNFGGLGKRLTVHRLAQEGETEVIAEFPIDELQSGCNPIYIRMMQEDGHLAWSSPIYLVVREE